MFPAQPASTRNVSVNFQQEDFSLPLCQAGSAHRTPLWAPASFPPRSFSPFLIMKIKEPIIPMTAVTTYRLNHKLCSKCLVCGKSSSLTYVSHYGVDLQGNEAGSSCRCKAEPCISCALLCTCSTARGGMGAQALPSLCSVTRGAIPVSPCPSQAPQGWLGMHHGCAGDNLGQ